MRLDGYPIGHIEVPLLPGTPCTAADLRRIIVRRLRWPILRHHLLGLTAAPVPSRRPDVEELLEKPHPPAVREPGGGSEPLVSVVVCTRDRTEELKLCLDSLVRLRYPNLEIMVVDNAPSSDATERLVRGSFPQTRYIREPRPGLDWARNRAILEASGEIIVYTDDDVVADSGWVSALVGAFGDPQAMAVTGLTVPYELETEAQVLFERYGGFGRGYRRKYWSIPGTTTRQLRPYMGGGQYGAGANMAFRRGVFDEVGYFDPALDVGTVTSGGGDTEMFIRILMEGHKLVYEPGALVYHRHRREYSQLRKQLADNSVGSFSYLVRVGFAYPEARLAAAWLGAWWYWYWNFRRLLVSYVRPPHVPRELILVEAWYSLVGLGRYHKARRIAERIASSNPYPRVPPPRAASLRQRELPAASGGVGVRTVDLGLPLRGLEDVTSYAAVRVFVVHHGDLLGVADVPNGYRPVSVPQLRDAIVDQLGLGLLRKHQQSDDDLRAAARAALERRYLPAGGKAPVATTRLPDAVSVSVVVPTYDRPHDLRECLSSLAAQTTARPLEVVVVDNHPASGLTPPVVAEFPGVALVSEARRGRAYASNKGFAAAQGEIIVSIDDDMIAPPDWLEKLLAPLARTDVAAVTGNTLPLELVTPAQRLFEEFSGFWRGATRWEADSEWFGSFRRRAVPTWRLGGTGNAAFRASILAHPRIGLMDEALGAGTPTGTGEDIYLFYKVLKAGYTIAYEPSAFAWHKHRREARAMRRQIYGYHKGHVAYHLVTLLRDRDPRAAVYLAAQLPKNRLKQLASYAKRRLLRRSYYPLRLVITEIKGNLAGPWSLWQSNRRVKREGHSEPYVPVPQHAHAQTKIRTD